MKMKYITPDEFEKIIANHQHYLNQDCEGWEKMRANLAETYLCEFNLQGVNLQGADLYGADLHRKNLSFCNLSGCNLSWSILSRSDLFGANLAGTNLSGSDLSHADLSRCNLTKANLTQANLYNTTLPKKERYRMGVILEKSIVGYKKCKDNKIVELLIPKGNIVFCINGSKCRTQSAKVKKIAKDDEEYKTAYSFIDDSFKYEVGKMVKAENFNLMYNIECSDGIHFFRTRKEAEDYCSW